jgi:hypothetical protein
MRWIGNSLAETVVVWMLAIAPPTISACECPYPR